MNRSEDKKRESGTEELGGESISIQTDRSDRSTAKQTDGNTAKQTDGNPGSRMETDVPRKGVRLRKGIGNVKRMLRGAALLLVIAAVLYLLANLSGIIPQKEGQVTTISKASLEEIFEISELSTVDYIYNAIAKAYEEDGNTIRYYVAYEGKVTAGIDFEKISIDKIDEENKRIEITLPDVEVHDMIVDAGTLEYIFTKDRYETETISQEAYKLCLEDMEKRISEETALYEMARENSVAAIEGLIEPWVREIDDEYTVVVK